MSGLCRTQSAQPNLRRQQLHVPPPPRCQRSIGGFFQTGMVVQVSPDHHRWTGQGTEQVGTQETLRFPGAIYLSISFQENIRSCSERIKVARCSLSTSGPRCIDNAQFYHFHHGVQACPSQQHFACHYSSGCTFLSGRGSPCSP